MRLKRFDGPGDWIGQARGKALKLVAQLLPGVDARVRYRIVFMERPLNEVIASQRTMYPKPGIRHDNRNFPQSRYNNI